MDYLNLAQSMMADGQRAFSDNHVDKGAGIGGMIGGGLGFLAAPFLGPLGPALGNQLGNMVGGMIGQKNAKDALEDQQAILANRRAKQNDVANMYKDLAQTQQMNSDLDNLNTEMNEARKSNIPNYFL